MQGEYLALQETVNTGLKKENELRQGNIDLMKLQTATAKAARGNTLIEDMAFDALGGDPGAQQFFIDRERERRAGGGNYMGQGGTNVTVNLDMDGENVGSAIGTSSAKLEQNAT